MELNHLPFLQLVIFSTSLEKLLKRCLILKQGSGTRKIDACDGKEVDQMFLGMSLCPGIVRC